MKHKHLVSQRTCRFPLLRARRDFRSELSLQAEHVQFSFIWANRRLPPYKSLLQMSLFLICNLCSASLCSPHPLFPSPARCPSQPIVLSNPSPKIQLSTLLCLLPSFHHHSAGSEFSCLALIHFLKLFLPIFCTAAKVTAIYLLYIFLLPLTGTLKRGCHSDGLCSSTALKSAAPKAPLCPPRSLLTSHHLPRHPLEPFPFPPPSMKQFDALLTARFKAWRAAHNAARLANED